MLDTANGAESACVKRSPPAGFPRTVPAPRSLTSGETAFASQANEPVTAVSPGAVTVAVALTCPSRIRSGASSAAMRSSFARAAVPLAPSRPSGLSIIGAPTSGQKRPFHCATASKPGSSPSDTVASAEAANGESTLGRRTTRSVSPLAANSPDRAVSDAVTARQRAASSNGSAADGPTDVSPGSSTRCSRRGSPNGSAADGSTDPVPSTVSRVDGRRSATRSRSSVRLRASSAPPSSKFPSGLRTDGGPMSGHRRSRHVPFACTSYPCAVRLHRPLDRSSTGACMAASKSSDCALPAMVNRPSCAGPSAWLVHCACRSRSKGSTGAIVPFAARRQVGPVTWRSARVNRVSVRCVERVTESTGTASPPATTVIFVTVTDGAASRKIGPAGHSGGAGLVGRAGPAVGGAGLARGAASMDAGASGSAILTPSIASAFTCTSPASSFTGSSDRSSAAAVRSNEGWRISKSRTCTVRVSRPETSPMRTRSPAHLSTATTIHRVPGSVVGATARSARTTASTAAATTPPRATARSKARAVPDRARASDASPGRRSPGP